jgi:hypothetical protein
MAATSALIPPLAAGHWLRAAGVRTGIVTNQSGVGRGLITTGVRRVLVSFAASGPFHSVFR